MPDHVHLLLVARSENSDFRRLMNTRKQKTGYGYMRRTGERLWQQGYYERVLRKDAQRLDVIDYLIANPLRAGLVRDIHDYPFWGSGVWTRAQLLDAIQCGSLE